MSHATLSPGATRAPSPAFPEPARGAAGGPFWSPAIGAGADAVLALYPQVDRLSQQVARMPIHISLTRPVVGQYLVALKTLAAAWNSRARPALAAALGALVQAGESLAQSGGPGTLRMLEGFQRRLARPLAALAALETDSSSQLARMAAASAELDADTRLVAQRLEADFVHAFMLSQQASGLQNRLDDARLRGQAAWIAGPHAGALRQEACLHASALDGVRRQLDQLRAEQSATQAEANYLQSLLPGLSTYLAAQERMGAGIGALLAGTRALALKLDLLREALAGDPGAADGIAHQLGAALPHWQALEASSAPLRRSGLS